MQEIILARSIKVYYASSEIPWYLIQVSAAKRRTQLNRMAGHVHWLAYHSNQREFAVPQSTDSITPYNAWGDLEDQACANPRDRYYGLQGLFEPKWRLAVDYSKPVAEVFVDAAAMIMWSCEMREPGAGNGNSAALCWKLAMQMGFVSYKDLGFLYATGYAVLSWWIHGHGGICAQTGQDQCSVECVEHLRGAFRQACGFEDARRKHGCSAKTRSSELKRHLDPWRPRRVMSGGSFHGAPGCAT